MSSPEIAPETPSWRRVAGLIVETRRSSGMTQEAVAFRLGVAGSTVRRWESGGGLPHFDVLVRLADVLGLGVDRLADAVRLDTLDQCPRWDSNPRSSDYKIVGALADVVDLSAWSSRGQVEREVEG